MREGWREVKRMELEPGRVGMDWDNGFDQVEIKVSSQRKRQALRPERPTTLPEWTEFILTVYGEVHAWVLLKQIDIEVVSNYGGQVVP